jgi:S-DNA-T family DNA segregation ATPase FtsK/SpoIIIE
MQRWTLLANVCPVFAQAAMLAVALAQRNWTFLAMIVPGVFMSGTYAFSALLRYREEKHTAATQHQALIDSQRQGAHSSALENSPSPVDLSILPSRDVATITADMWKAIVRAWVSSPPEMRHGLRVVTGAVHGDNNDDGATAATGPHSKDALSLDICSQGPHALIAGTTGSGKSMFLQSWCVAMALAHPPSRLNFIFLDFKGGATFRTLHRLPHTVGFVSDLNLSHAVRALQAIEAELTRREKLVAQHQAATIDELLEPPARIVIVVDEFHALRFALPDYSDHLVRIAAQGRSLGMNLILATQNPLGQVSTDMKANINLNICLRVRDSMQSIELLGIKEATSLPTAAPGMGILNDSESITVFRSAVVRDETAITAHCSKAARFCGEPPASALFTPPLTTRVTYEDVFAAAETAHTRDENCGSSNGTLLVGIFDDGVLTHSCRLNPELGNIAIIGAPTRGKTTCAQNIAAEIRERYPTSTLRWTTLTDLGYLDTNAHTSPDADTCPNKRTTLPDFWIVDGADDLLDPLSVDHLHNEFSQALSAKSCCVIFTCVSGAHVRYPEHCATRIVFPSGEQTADVMAGIPPALLKLWQPQEYEIPGRAVVLNGSTAYTLQCCARRDLIAITPRIEP